MQGALALDNAASQSQRFFVADRRSIDDEENMLLFFL